MGVLIRGGREREAFELSASSTAPTAEGAERSAPVDEDTPLRPGLVTIFPVPPNDAPDVWPITGKRALGRRRDAHVHLDDERVSRLHATLEPRAGGLLIKDQGSRHGTFLNGVPVSAEGTLVRRGGVVRSGNTLLLCVDDVERFRARPRRSDGARFGLAERMLAGPVLAAVWDEAVRAAALKEPVLILGESGSGKECVARILHVSRAEQGPFVGINATAIPEALFEAELFGHERGAFTGASGASPGAFREADGGVLFLDEVGDLKLEMQAKLLRALDRRQIRPLGAKHDVAVSARVVSATGRDLKKACEAGEFRADLYYRLSGLVIRVPPLRERPGDVILLALDVLQERSPHLTLTVEAAERLVLAGWEGNARQLRHTLSRAASQAVARAEDRIRPEHLPDLAPLVEASSTLTVERIQRALERSGGVASRAARALGVSRTTFYKSLKRLNVQRTDAPSEK